MPATTANPPFTDARRELPSLLAPAERRLLVWLAARMPAWITPDHLTLVALAGMAIAAAGYWLGARRPPALALVVVGLALHWFGDSLDGTLARLRRTERPRYGFYVDHLLDSVSALLLLGGLAASGVMSAPVALGLLAAFYLMSIEVYLAAYARATFRIAYWRLGPTELRLILAAGTLALPFWPTATLLGWTLPLFDAGGLAAIAGLVVTTAVSAARNTAALYRAETNGRRPAPPTV
ncbi:MAG TPA: CDP-alcohol phosphatidyltransferase family protein [Vicinamibacterales bacterium]|nr:CDP-alcohol phosphatidyltransferase family protein [Vicinamibacterales bacterium]